MRLITLCETRNGWLIVDGELRPLGREEELPPRCWSFNSIDKLIAQVRLVAKGWKEKKQSANQAALEAEKE